MGVTMTALSAVICTRQRPAQLARALGSLLAQDPAVAEVLVVDNAPHDGATQRLVTRAFPQVRYVREPLEGLNFARNRALREARMPLLAFLDDDAVASPGWAAALTARFASHPRLAVCTGRVEALELSTEAQRFFEANGGFGRGEQPIALPADAARLLHGRRAPLIAWAVSIGNGASFAVRRPLALALGGFDEALDLGAALPGGGDLDVFWRALSAGYELHYEPQALAWHEHRRTHEAMIAQLAGHQRALTAFLCKSAAASTGWRRMPVLGFLGWRLLKPWGRLTLRLVGRDPLPAGALWRMGVQTWAGLASYPRSVHLARRRRLALEGSRP